MNSSTVHGESAGIAGTAIAAGWEWAAALTGVVAGAGAAHIVRIVGAVTRRA